MLSYKKLTNRSIIERMGSMKREEKNQQTKRRIMDSALKEFTEQGYGGSSVNHICEGEGFSKGIIFHYFQTKDELYLACVDGCFRALTEYLREKLILEGETVHRQLQLYFDARFEFFQAFPMYRRIFCEAVIMPPAHLESAVRQRKSGFDEFNISILNRILEPLKLRGGVSRETVVDIFLQFQDYINAKYQSSGEKEIDFKTHEEDCRRALDVLLHGVVERKDVDI